MPFPNITFETLMSSPIPSPGSPTPPGSASTPAPSLASKQQRRRRRFYHRLLRAFLLASGMIAFSLSLGVLGYHWVAGLEWIDALLNASMILTGMGPVDRLPDTASKLFASVYALFAGLVFISATGILLGPVFHRVLHQFKIDEQDLNS